MVSFSDRVRLYGDSKSSLSSSILYIVAVIRMFICPSRLLGISVVKSTNSVLSLFLSEDLINFLFAFGTAFDLELLLLVCMEIKKDQLPALKS